MGRVGGAVSAGDGAGAEAERVDGEVRPGVKGARGTARPTTGSPHSPTYVQWHSRPGSSGAGRRIRPARRQRGAGNCATDHGRPALPTYVQWQSRPGSSGAGRRIRPARRQRGAGNCATDHGRPALPDVRPVAVSTGNLERRRYPRNRPRRPPGRSRNPGSRPPPACAASSAAARRRTGCRATFTATDGASRAANNGVFTFTDGTGTYDTTGHPEAGIRRHPGPAAPRPRAHPHLARPRWSPGLG